MKEGNMSGSGENDNGNGSRTNGINKKGRPTFQLCFAAAQEQGRSAMSRPKLPMHATLITPKFYSDVDRLRRADDRRAIDPLVTELAEEIEDLINYGPREKYSEPLIESHCYGWDPEPLIPIVKTDRRFHHHRITSEMVRVQGILLNATRAEKEFDRILARKSKGE